MTADASVATPHDERDLVHDAAWELLLTLRAVTTDRLIDVTGLSRDTVQGALLELEGAGKAAVDWSYRAEELRVRRVWA